MNYFDDHTISGFISVRRSGLTRLLAVAFVAGAAVFSGCGFLSSDNAARNTGLPENQAGAAESTPAETSAETSSSPCDNPYYPVDPGMVRKYRLSSKLPDGGREYTLKQKMVDETTFAEIRSYSSGLTLSVNWNCTEEGLRAAEYVSQAQMQAAQFQMETLESSGISIPNEWSLGKEWSSSYKVKANLDAGPVKAAADGTVTLEHKLAAEGEKITVPGGEFEANRVDTVIRIDLKMQKANIPVKEFRSSVWFSPKVGIVKQRAYGDFGEETVEFIGFE
ncbi:MAG: hypothetical protein J5I65_00035 [Aridibacter famidurans]|nr:hypothetical protein [Aridibacter famidurans]